MLGSSFLTLMQHWSGAGAAVTRACECRRRPHGDSTNSSTAAKRKPIISAMPSIPTELMRHNKTSRGANRNLRHRSKKKLLCELSRRRLTDLVAARGRTHRLISQAVRICGSSDEQQSHSRKGPDCDWPKQVRP